MRKLLAPAIVIFALVLTGCKKEIRTNNPTQLSEISASAKKPGLSAADLKAKLQKLVSSLPPGSDQRLIEKSSLLLKQHPQYREIIRNVLAVTPTPCDANTLVSQWLDEQLADWDSDIITLAVVTGMLDFPTYDALLFENSPENQYFGTNGQYTHIVNKTFKDLNRFWDIDSDGIIVVGLHGTMLQDRERVIRIDQILFGDDRATAEFWADLILDLLAAVPQYRNGNHPIFSFNAFAQPSFAFPPYGTIPDKIVMGDGIMDAYSAIGFGDVAPQAILAHEYAHHIQFQLDLFAGDPSAEATRRTELMADAFAAYYLSHARGASMQWKRVKQFLQVFLNIGDCAFTSTNHHGTPTQRMAAAEWGYSVADNAQKQGHILSAEEFVALFDAQLPYIVTL